ncbi:MAG TPA: P-loop NTPase fold protein [Candidatus Sulfotelmatobacter sp.]|jgi:hypothetical protein|nr:P-loop NTPase fold protein [Candidatus Sulfotelmatobacter sp.]
MAAHLVNHNDEPSLHDSLKRDKLIIEMAQTIAESDSPLVFGLHGDWGSGKTSCLRQLKEYLEVNGALTFDQDVQKKSKTYSQLTVVWFEAWRFQHETTPIVALLHEIRDHFAVLTKTTNAIKKLGEVGIRGLLRTFTELGFSIGGAEIKVGGLADNVQGEGERWEQEHHGTCLPTAKIRQFLEEAIHQLLGGKLDDDKDRRRLLVVVDDLDRCEGEAIVRFLEGIKIYLNLKRCVFVLGVNQREVERAVAYHLFGCEPNQSVSDEARGRSADYVDKICTFIWKLPIPTNAQKVAYAKELLTNSGLPKPITNAATKVIDDYDCLPANPRKIKAFVNTVLHLVRARESATAAKAQLTEVQEGDVSAICLVALFHLFHPTVLRYLQIYPDYFEQVRRLAMVGFKDSPKELGVLLATHTYSTNEQGAPNLPPTPLFVDPADNRFCRAQRLIVEGKLTDAALRPFFGLVPL